MFKDFAPSSASANEYIKTQQQFLDEISNKRKNDRIKSEKFLWKTKLYKDREAFKLIFEFILYQKAILKDLGSLIIMLNKGGQEFYFGHIHGLWRFNQTPLHIFERCLVGIQEKVMSFVKDKTKAYKIVNHIQELDIINFNHLSIQPQITFNSDLKVKEWTWRGCYLYNGQKGGKEILGCGVQICQGHVYNPKVWIGYFKGYSPYHSYIQINENGIEYSIQE